MHFSGRCIAALVLVGLGIAPTIAGAGSNAGARIWLSWDPAGTTRTLSSWSGLDTVFYVQMEGLSDVSALAVALNYSNPGQGQGVVLTATSTNNQYGWVEDSTVPLEFLGDSSFSRVLRFPGAIRPRARVVYGLERLGAPAASYCSEWSYITCPVAVVMDHFGNLDTLRSLGDCRVWLGAPGSREVAAAPAGQRGAQALVKVPPGAIQYAGKHFAASDCPPEWAQRLESVGFEIGERVFSIDALDPPESTLITPGGVVVKMPDLSRWVVLHCSDSLSVNDLLSGLTQVTDFEACQPVRELEPLRVPNDSVLNWYINPNVPAQIGMTAAWDITTGSDSINVAILDTGVDYGHPDLDPGDRSHVTRGHDTGEDDDDPMDEDGHGTEVASILGALTDNNRLIAGTMWNVSIVPIKTADSNGDLDTRALADGIYWADLLSCDIMNISQGSYESDGALAEAVFTEYLHNRAMFAATGNDNREVADPARLPYVCAVGASNGSGDRAPFSNYGPELRFIAPGEFLWALSRWSHDEPVAASGTSVAAPVAAGVAGLVKSYAIRNNLTLYNDDLYEILGQTATDVPPIAGWDEETGYGVLNAARALAILRPPYVSLRGTTGGVATRVSHNVEVHFISVPEINESAYWCDRYEVRGHVTGCGLFQQKPFAWGRPLLSRGYRYGENAGQTVVGAPWARVENVTAAGFDVVTYVYYVAYGLQGAVDRWVPCRPEEAVMAYMASGLMSIQGVDIEVPSRTCIGSIATWSASLCGDEPAAFEWRVRVPGGEWSEVVGTSPTYSRTVESGGLEVKLAVTGSMGTVADSATTYGEYCVVGVDSSGGFGRYDLATLGNPVRERCVGWIRVPSPASVRLEVFDVGGRRVRDIGDLRCEVGETGWSWDGRGDQGARLGGGMYFVRASSVHGARTVRVVLLR